MCPSLAANAPKDIDRFLVFVPEIVAYVDIGPRGCRQECDVRGLDGCGSNLDEPYVSQGITNVESLRSTKVGGLPFVARRSARSGCSLWM
jgi:hypothetical protein